MFGLSILETVVDGVKDHFKGKQELKKLEAEAKKKVLEAETQAKVATQMAKIDMLTKSQDNDFKLDMIAMQSMNKSWKDEFVLAIFLFPLIGAFVPQLQGYVMGGFQLMEFIPQWWIYLTIGMVVSIMGLRGLLHEFMKNKNRFKLPKGSDTPKEVFHPPAKSVDIISTYKSKYFKIEELVPKELYDKYSEGELWSMLDSSLLKDLDKLKEVFNKGTMTINNWKWGGKRNWSGIRTEGSPYYSAGSMHSFGKAFDIIFSDYEAERVRGYIKEHRDMFKAIKGLERNKNGKPISWVHIDTKDRGHLYFNV